MKKINIFVILLFVLLSCSNIDFTNAKINVTSILDSPEILLQENSKIKKSKFLEDTITKNPSGYLNIVSPFRKNYKISNTMYVDETIVVDVDNNQKDDYLRFIFSRQGNELQLDLIKGSDIRSSGGKDK